MLYADGHAEAKAAGDWLQGNALWGGALALRQSKAHLGQSYPLLQKVQAALDTGDEKNTIALLKYNHLKAKEALGQVFRLWQQNGGGNDENGSLTVEKWGWRLGQLCQATGETGMLAEMNREQSARSAVVLQAVNAGAWQKHQSDLGFSLDYPAGWTVETETDGRYRNTYFRSASPYIEVLVERGERTTPGPEAGIAWEGMERDYQKTYGSSYQRIRMGTTMLGGEVASLWEFELERPGEPRLHKFYIGRSHRWNSFVLVAAAPAQDFKNFQAIFGKMDAFFTGR